MSPHSEPVRDASACRARRRVGRHRRTAAALSLAAFGLCLLLAATASAATLADQDWIGRRVVQKDRGFRLRIGDQSIDPEEVFVYRVEQVDGPSLRLQASERGLNGWASRSGRPG